MIGFQGQTLSLIYSLIVVASTLTVARGEQHETIKEDKALLENEEFKTWIELQEERVVQKIMEKITSPNDTNVQHEAKVAVARYLVNVTFTAMTKRLERQKNGRKQSFLPASAALPTSAVTESPNLPTEIATLSEKNETVYFVSNVSSTTQAPTEGPLIFKGNGDVTPSPSVNSETKTANTTFISLPFSSIGVESIAPAYSTLTEQIAAEGGIVTTTAFPLFAALSEFLGESKPAPPPSSSSQNETITTNENGTDTMESSSEKPKPIWEELLTFNFSAALMGGADASSILKRLNINTGGEGGGNLLSRLNLTGLGGGGNGGGGLLGNLNLTALGSGNGGEGGGGPLSRLNLSALTGGGGNGGGDLLQRLNLTGLTGGNGGEGGAGGLLARLNLTGLGGNGGEGGAGGLLARLNLTGLGGGEGGGLLARLNLTGLGGGSGGGNILSRLNLTALLGGGNGGGNLLSRLNLTGGPGAIFSRFNLSSLNQGGMKAESGNATSEGNSTIEGGGGLMFNLLPGAPEGLFNIPTPPPKNDSVRLSQIALGNQVEQLMGSINNSNLTGIVESSINIASPSTVGVLVNALLNILLCNPIDRFNGNCGIE